MKTRSGSDQSTDRTHHAPALRPAVDAPSGADPAPDPIRESWERIAADFDRHVTPFTLRLGEEVVERAGVRRGMQLLDVAAGSGAVSLAAARRGAHVLATDISPTMVERLQARARAEGLPNVTARAMDGHALELEDETFDLAVSQHGVSLFPDVARGLAEMVRVTRAGGRVVIVSFGPIREAEFLTFFTGAIRAVVPGFSGLPTDPPPLPFQLADPETLRRRMEEAGLSEIRVEQAAWEMEFESGRHLWETATSSNPIARGLAAQLDDAQRGEVRSVLDGMLRERSGRAGGVLRNAINIGLGRK